MRRKRGLEWDRRVSLVYQPWGLGVNVRRNGRLNRLYSIVCTSCVWCDFFLPVFVILPWC